MGIKNKTFICISSLCVFVITATCIGVILFSIGNHRRHTGEEFTKQSLFLARRAGYFIRRDDRAALKELLLDACRDRPSILYTFIERDGQPLAYTICGSIPKGLPELPEGPGDGLDVREFDDDREGALCDIAAPVDDGKEVLRLGYSWGELAGEMTGVMAAVGLIGACVAAIGILAAWHIAGLIALGPEKTLSEQRRKITDCEHENKEMRTEFFGLDQVFSSAAASLCLIDTDYNIIKANEAMEQLTGIPVEGIVGRKCHEIFKGRSCHADLCMLVRIQRGEQTSEMEVKKVRPDGTAVLCLVTASPLRDTEGNLIGIIEGFRDISKLKQVEKDLKENAILVEMMGDALLVMDIAGDIIKVNRAAADLWGYSTEELIGMNHDRLVPGDVLEMQRNEIKEIEGRKTTRPFETEIVTKDDKKIPVIISGTVTRHVGGRPNVFIGVFKNITERKAMEAQLIHSEKMAGIGQLAAGVAHEINNPTGFVASNLNTLKEYACDLAAVLKECRRLVSACCELEGEAGETAAKADELWRKCDVDYILGDLEKLVQESMEGTGRIKMIVEDLKDFSRSDNPDMEEADINEAIDKALSIAWNEIKYKADVVKEYGDLPLIKCAVGQVEQAFLNILVNAVQAIEERGTITIRTRVDGDSLYVEFSDTGPGISPDIQKKIFDPFFTTKPAGKGTGLGLHITYSIIKHNKGDITVRSKPGEGTTFAIRLPIPDEQEESQGESLEPHSKKAE